MASSHEPVTTGRRGLLLIGCGFGLVFLVGLMGPSAVAVTLPQRAAWHPPFWIDLQPSPWVVIGLVLTALVCGAIGVHLGLRALAAGWLPNLRRLVGVAIGGVTAIALVPPMGSGDILMYAAYGRISALGHSPYVTAPVDISRLVHDPVTSSVELPWQGTTTVYGPVATWLQEAASRISGGSTHTTVMWLQLTNALAYVVVGLLVLVLAGRDPRARARAVLLLVANPVLVWAVVAGGHNDAQAVVFAVAALVVAKRSPLAAGVLLGLGGAVKLNVALFGLALLWGMRRSKRNIGELCAGAVLALVGTYGLVGPHAFDQVRAASGFISSGSQWQLILEPLHDLIPGVLARTLIVAAALISMVLVAILLARAFPPPVRPSVLEPHDPRPEAVRAAAVLCIAWLVTAPYVLPWYALAAWVPLALLAPSAVDRWLLAWTAIVAAAYVAGRVVKLPPSLQLLKVETIQDVMPVVLTVLAALLIRMCWKSRLRFRSPPLPQDPVLVGRE
ncbi:MAG: polyprenol phosphomannose-dependent alpha 1,6 mannosyltransferase MptB [Pseudonocardiales bacterium]|nr:polyprenol phosphomannose-dependent alpha 1,6 mannosyltransferase MptB [Pseudonocardiales bacterium]